MRRRSPLRNGLEYAVAIAALKSLEWAPLGVAHRLGRAYAGLLDRSMPRLRRVAEFNLTFAMPELDAAERSRIVDGVFRSIGRILVSFAKFPAIRRDNVS